MVILRQSVKEQIAAAAHGADIDDIAVFLDVARQRLQEVPQVVRAHGNVRILDALSHRVLFLLLLFHQSALHVCTRPKASETCRDSCL